MRVIDTYTQAEIDSLDLEVSVPSRGMRVIDSIDNAIPAC